MTDPPTLVAADSAAGRAHIDGPAHRPSGIARALRFWRSPPGQPCWARPALLGIAVLAALAYGWNMGAVTLEPFYGGAARSMSESWHNFFFGALDPWGTVSVDKLPGALWLQALSLRLFGFHPWAIVLPQVVEGTLTVLVLYRAVRRVAGAGAGLVAAVVLAVSPVNLLLNRGNISDSLLILLLVLAADATTASIVEGRTRSLMVAGLWVGLAFQAKMLQAWIVLPALYLAYVVASPAVGAWRRLGHVGLSALVVVLVSLSWMTAVSAVPAHDRPFVDGSCDNSLYSQVFEYNGLARLSGDELDRPGCSPASRALVLAARRGALQGLGTFGIHRGWDRLLWGDLGRDDAWFLVPSLVGAVALFVSRRRRPRTDAPRAAAILWTTWLLLTGLFFSAGVYLNSYYLAALVPAMAALCGLGAAVAWHHRTSAVTKVAVLCTVVGTAAYSLALLPADIGIRAAVLASTVVVTTAAAVLLVYALRRPPGSVRLLVAGLGLSAVALCLGAGWASFSVLANGQGPFDTPYQPNEVTYLSQTRPTALRAQWPKIVAFADTFPADHAVDVLESSGAAGYDIMVTGHEFLPVGGFSGRVPVPTVTQLAHDVADGRVTRVSVTVSPLTRNPVLRWVTRRCTPLHGVGNVYVEPTGTIERFHCAPADVLAVTEQPRWRRWSPPPSARAQ